MTGERAGLRRYPLHEIAIRGDDVGKVIDDGVARAVKAGAQVGLGDGKADRVTDALPEWAGGGLDTRGHVRFGVPRCLALPLAEVHNVFH